MAVTETKPRRGRGTLAGEPCQILAEPEGLTSNQRLFRRAVINSGLPYPAFGKVIGWTGTDKTVTMRVQLKMRGFRGVTDSDLIVIRAYGDRIDEDLFRTPSKEIRAIRVKGRIDGRNSQIQDS